MATPVAVVLAGCLAFAVSVVLPVMRWRVSAVHPTAGSARVFTGDAFTLVDAGFPGAALIPPAALAVGLLAIAAALTAFGRTTWRMQVVAAIVAAYYPAWVSYVFVRKWEDDVFPAEGAVLLAASFAAIGAGLFVTRPRRGVQEDEELDLTTTNANHRPATKA